MKIKAKSKIEVKERRRSLFCLSPFCLSPFLLSSFLLLGCSRPKVERTEWVVMDTIAAVQFRGGREDARTTRRVQEVFLRVTDEFNAFDRDSVINRTGECSDFGRPCWDFAFKLKEQTGGAFNPYWKGGDKLDFGAVAKGFAVDVAAESVRTNSLPQQCGLLIDLGGNLKAARGDWTVGIRDGESFTLHEGEACATSARYYRGSHIKDARTGLDVTSAVHSVTVVHPSSAMIADGLSTVLFILGRERGEAFLKANYPEARAVWAWD